MRIRTDSVVLQPENCTVSLTIIENGEECGFSFRLTSRTSDYEICPEFADKMGSIITNYRVKMNELDSVSLRAILDAQIVDIAMEAFRRCSSQGCSFVILGTARTLNTCLINCTTEETFVRRGSWLLRIEQSLHRRFIESDDRVHTVGVTEHLPNPAERDCSP